MNLLLHTSVFALFFGVALSASKCGKGGLKVRYGLNKVFTSPALESGACKYRLKVAAGLNIKLTLRSYSTGHSLTVYDGTAKPFNARRAKQFPVPNPPQSSGKVLQFDTHMIVMKLDISAGSSPTSFIYEAVLPAGGNFGYDIDAVAKAKSIRSPGFPRSKLPSGIQSTWNIRSGEGEAVWLSFTGLQMAKNTDYVEVHDGDLLLGRHSGKMNKRNPIEHIAHSGRMTITMNTATSESRGFKAKYRALKVNTTSPVTTSGAGLTCHKRSRVLSKGVALSDSHSSMTCESREICGRMVSEGTSKQYSSFTITRETLHCIPRDLCAGTVNACTVSPSPPPTVTIKSCNITCCDTNMCNRSPDGPDVPPSETEVALPPTLWPQSPSVLRCNQQSEVIIEGGPGLGSASGDGEPCPNGGVCGLFVFKGNSNGNPAHGFSAMCSTQSQCDEPDCSSIPDASGITIETCEATCCSTDSCNNPSRPSPPPFTSPQSTLQCYEILNSRTNDVILINEKKPKACFPGSKCVLMKATAIDSSGRTSTSTYGSCVPEIACKHINCDLLKNTAGITSVDSCDMKCCDEDLCNDNVDEPSTEQPVPGTLQCYDILTSVAGSINVLNKKEVKTCGADDKCFRIDAVARHASLDAKITTVYGGCMPRYACGSVDCNNMPRSVSDVTIIDCSAACCDTSLCNEHALAPSSTVSPPPAARLRCHQQSKITKQGASEVGFSDNAMCPIGDVCGLYVFTGSENGVPVSGYATRCASQDECDQEGCSSLPETSGIDITSCNPTCCNTDMCNQPPSVALTPASDSVSQCYDITLTMMGTITALDKREVMTCESTSSKCMRLDATGTDSLGNEVIMAFGRCVPALSCGGINCQLMSPSVPGVTMTSCDAGCCDSDLCNGRKLVDPDKPSARAPQIPPSVETGSSLQCHFGTEMRVLNRLLPGGSRTVKRCPAGSKCLDIKATGTHSALSGRELTIKHGACLKSALCDQANCNLIPMPMQGMSFENCVASCCDSDLCNA